MGCGASSPVDDGAKARSESIERQLKEDARRAQSEIKMLLLGAGESGKSTLLKQYRLLHQQPWSNEEREAFKEVVWSNATQSMRVLIEGAAMMGIPLEPTSRPHAEAILNAPAQIEGDAMPRDLAEAVRWLWQQEEGIQEAFGKRSHLQLNDSAGYYFDHIDEMASTRYLPSDQDILRSRVKSTGITESTFIVKDMTYRIFDVGGQRSERKKWIHCFENVSCLVCVIALNEYNQSLYEDTDVNRMTEAAILFDSVINSRWFANSTRIVFFNKIDLLEEKLPREPLADIFPEYAGTDLESALSFLEHRFLSLNKSHQKVYSHRTTATDTNQVRFVMDAVQDQILSNNLRSAGFV